MNIDKYNKRLLAVIGTTIVIIAIGAALISLVLFVISIIPDRDQPNTTDIAIDQTETNQTLETNSLEITYGFPNLIDSSQQLFVIPVGQRLEFESLDEMEESYRGSFSSYSKGRKHTGLYNNLVVFDQKNRSRKAIFKTKMAITSYQALYRDGKVQIAINGAVHDTNNDGYLNDDDLRDFYIYFVDLDTLQPFSIEKHDVNSFNTLPNSDELILELTNDINGNGTSDYKEPKSFKLVDSEYKLENLIDLDLERELEQIIN